MQKVKEIWVYFICIFYIIHILCFFISDKKKLIVSDIYSINKRRNRKWSNLYSLVYYLCYDDYFLVIFKHRIKGCTLHSLISVCSNRNFIIPKDVVIGESISYSHPYSTILNAKKIGSNFSFKHLTTIGNKNDNEDLRPIILDNVILGAGVTIIGDITIGNNVVVGAGTVIVKSVPDNSVVVGNPARIIKSINKVGSYDEV